MTADAVGGVWTYALDLTRALAPYGVEVELATMGPEPDEAQRAAAGALPNVRLHVSTYRLEWMDDPWDDVAAAGEWLLALEERLEPDVVHLNGYAHGALPWRAPVLVVGHSCVCSWFEAVEGRQAPPWFGRYRQEVSRGLAGADLVTAPTEAMLAALERHYGAFESAGAVLNGRRAEDFPPGVKEPCILTAGRLWDEAKNVAALARAAGAVRWPVYVAGEARHPGDGSEVAFDGVVPLGRLTPEALAAWMGRASIYALPARYEPFGLTPLEAALAGCALVLGDVPTLREVWGDAAMFVPPADEDALADVLQRLIDDPARRDAMATRARRRALALTLERTASGYLSFYRHMLAGSAGSPERDAREGRVAVEPSAHRAIPRTIRSTR